MNLFYHPGVTVGHTIEMESSEATHISRVLRKKSGDMIHITDGRGNLFEALLEVKKNAVEAIMQSVETSLAVGPFLEIAIAPPKNNERLEWFVEKAVEIGIAKISLIHCEHSERPYVKMDRIERVAISAMKQSLRVFLPEIIPVQSFGDWLKGCNTASKCIAHCNTSVERWLLKDAVVKGDDVAIAIGPEGDFSMKETRLAIDSGFKSVSLGSSRLRTETAALAAVHTFELINQ